MDIQLRLGTQGDLDLLAQLYDDVHEHLLTTTNYPGWVKGDYPTRQDAVEGVNDGCLFVATADGTLVGSLILRSQPEPAYLGAAWGVDLDYAEVSVVHTFAVSPSVRRGGVGKQILQLAEQRAKEANMRALRLDVYEKNLPAISLYEQSGFQYIGTVSLGLERHGLDWFRLYEKLI